MQINHKNQFKIGLLLFFTINLVQACFLEPHSDENYYWVYSKFPAWGYFDHPPMVAWLIRAGNFFFDGYIGLRLFFVLFSTFTFYSGWRLIKEYLPDPVFYWAMVFSVAMFAPYSFMALPDVALLLFSVQFLWIYREFIQRDKYRYAILLGIVAAAMVYSKYHALLFFLLVFLSNPKLIRNAKAWLAVFIALFLLVPHILWQVTHQFPTFNYHLNDRFHDAYRFSFTSDFIANQLILTGPFLGWLFLFAASTIKTDNLLERAMKFVFTGTFLFFLIMTHKGHIEPHWTLVAIFPMMILTAKWASGKSRWKTIIIKTGLATFALGIVLRAFVLLYGSQSNIPFFKLYFNELADKKNLHQHVGNYPVVFQESYQITSAYAYANNRPFDTYLMTPGFSRITQYDFYPIEESLQGKTVVYATLDSLLIPGGGDIVKGGKHTWFTTKIEDFKSFTQLKVLISKEDIHVDGNSINVKKIVLQNPYKHCLVFNDRPETEIQFRCYLYTPKGWKILDAVDPGLSKLNSGESFIAEDVRFSLPAKGLTQGQEIFIGLGSGFYLPVNSGIITTIHSD